MIFVSSQTQSRPHNQGLGLPSKEILRDLAKLNPEDPRAALFKNV
jgi:hypothetical protein